MGKSRKIALHAAHVASTEPRDLTGAPRDLHGLGLTNWRIANNAQKVTILHYILNDDEEGMGTFTGWRSLKCGRWANKQGPPGQ